MLSELINYRAEQGVLFFFLKKRKKKKEGCFILILLFSDYEYLQNHLLSHSLHLHHLFSLQVSPGEEKIMIHK